VLTNTGNATLTITSVGVTGDFMKTSQCPSQVAPGGSCNVLVAFKPRNKGVRNGTLSFTDNAPGSPQTVPLTGTGTVVQLVPPSLDFGSQKVGTKSAPQTVTLTNTGSTNLSIAGITITGNNPTDFNRATTCSFVTPLAPGANCTITVTFKPTAQGARSATVNVKDNGGGSPQLIPLTGTGT